MTFVTKNLPGTLHWRLHNILEADSCKRTWPLNDWLSEFSWQTWKWQWLNFFSFCEEMNFEVVAGHEEKRAVCCLRHFWDGMIVVWLDDDCGFFFYLRERVKREETVCWAERWSRSADRLGGACLLHHFFASLMGLGSQSGIYKRIHHDVATNVTVQFMKS